jgi:hypothetical protein
MRMIQYEINEFALLQEIEHSWQGKLESRIKTLDQILTSLSKLEQQFLCRRNRRRKDQK